MNHKRKKRVRLFTIILFICSIIFILSFVRATLINQEIQILMNEFKNEAILMEDMSNENMKYYHVSRETKENKPAFYDKQYLYPGTMGDIIVDLESPFYIPVVRELQTLFVGGHALISYGEEILEITGNIFRTDNRVQFMKNEYITNSELNSFVGLRVNGMWKEDYQILDLYLRDQIGKKYNYLYLFNTKNTFYCTDIVSRAYASLNKGYNLNRSGGLVTVQDLIVSDDTYIFMIKETDKDGIAHIYYLE